MTSDVFLRGETGGRGRKGKRPTPNEEKAEGGLPAFRIASLGTSSYTFRGAQSPDYERSRFRPRGELLMLHEPSADLLGHDGLASHRHFAPTGR